MAPVLTQFLIVQEWMEANRLCDDSRLIAIAFESLARFANLIE